MQVTVMIGHVNRGSLLEMIFKAVVFDYHVDNRAFRTHRYKKIDTPRRVFISWIELAQIVAERELRKDFHRLRSQLIKGSRIDPLKDLFFHWAQWVGFISPRLVTLTYSLEMSEGLADRSFEFG